MRLAGLPMSFSVALFAAANLASAQTLAGSGLVDALQHGGYVIVMRHASSPMQPPAKDQADPENTNAERQLDDRGKKDATDFGAALRRLKIPIGEVLSSPTYRALETIRLANLPQPRIAPELGENGRSMQGSSTAQADWLRHQVTEFPKGSNTLLVTHYPNLTAAFPQEATGVADGEALIFGPDGKGGATLVARVKIGDWPQLQP